MMNRRSYFVFIVLINCSFLSAMDTGRLRRNQKVARSTLEGRLRLNKTWVEGFYALESWDKNMAIRSLHLTHLAIRHNYNLFDPEDSLLKETIAYYNSLVALLKKEGHANDDDFFWETVEPNLVPRQSATIEEITESDSTQLTRYTPNNSPLLITAPNNQRNQHFYHAVKYLIVSGGLIAFTMITKLYKWLRTKNNTQHEEHSLSDLSAEKEN